MLLIQNITMYLFGITKPFFHLQAYINLCSTPDNISDGLVNDMHMNLCVSLVIIIASDRTYFISIRVYWNLSWTFVIHSMITLASGMGVHVTRHIGGTACMHACMYVCILQTNIVIPSSTQLVCLSIFNIIHATSTI